MRPWLAFIVCVTILGGLRMYMELRPRPAAHTVHETPVSATGAFRAELTLSFVAGPDSFALDAATAPSLVVSLDGRELLRRTDVINAGETISLGVIDRLKVGDNEFFLQATPRDPAGLACAIRVRMWRDSRLVAEETLWSEPGDRVEGTVVLSLTREGDDSTTSKASDEHE